MFGFELPQALKREQLDGAFDGVLLAAIAALLAIGVVMVASSSVAIGESHGSGPSYYLQRHLVYVGVGLFGALLLTRIELRFIERHATTLLILAIALLVVVLIPGLGRRVNGAQRWIELGVVGFQAVEAVKLLLIVWLSAYMVKHRDQLQSTLWGAFKPVSVAAILGVLLLLQPDFGSAVLLGVITVALLWLGGVRAIYLALAAAVGLVLVVLLAVAAPYRMARLASFRNPFDDPFGSGYQLVHALIAIGRGEATGVGLGGSVQKLYYLPEAHTDFIFSVYAEETGFIGVVVLVALFVLLIGRALWLGARAQELGRHFSAHCAFGVALWLGLQSMISIGVNLGVLPTKGLTLPLISSGGSSVMMTCVALGLLLRVSYETERARRQSGRLRGEDTLDPAELLAARSPAVRAAELLAAQRAQGIRGAAPSAAQGRVEPRMGALP